MDLIERQMAIDAVESAKTARTPDGEIYVAKLNAEMNIQILPSAQPEIIRCKDCTWWSNDEYRECSSPNYDNVHVTPAGFYCGYAEKRGEPMDDLIERKAAIDAVIKRDANCGIDSAEVLKTVPSAQPELIEKTAYIRGFEQGRTQGMIASQGGKK